MEKGENSGTTMEFNFNCSDVQTWREALGSYPTRIASLEKPELDSLDDFYRSQLPPLLRSRLPAPYLTRSELTTLMQWKLTRGKFRPRLPGFVNSLDEDVVKSASEKAFLALPDLAKAVSSLTFSKEWAPPPPPPSSPPMPRMSPHSCLTRLWKSRLGIQESIR